MVISSRLNHYSITLTVLCQQQRLSKLLSNINECHHNPRCARHHQIRQSQHQKKPLSLQRAKEDMMDKILEILNTL